MILRGQSKDKAQGAYHFTCKQDRFFGIDVYLHKLRELLNHPIGGPARRGSNGLYHDSV